LLPQRVKRKLNQANLLLAFKKQKSSNENAKEIFDG